MNVTARTHSRGFTLVELLVALSLMTLLATLVFTGLRLGTRAWEAVSLQAGEDTEALQVQSFMRRQLLQALEVQLRDGDGNLRPGFKGEPNRLLFVSTLPEPLGNGAPHWFALHQEEVLESEQSDYRYPLVIYYWPYQVVEEGEVQTEEQQLVDWDEFWAPQKLAERRRTVLWESFPGIRLEYFGIREQATLPDWGGEWEEAQLPDLIRFTFSDDVSRSDGGRKAWPDLLVTPMVKSYVVKQPL